jgi:hypothetical protein
VQKGIGQSRSSTKADHKKLSLQR